MSTEPDPGTPPEPPAPSAATTPDPAAQPDPASPPSPPTQPDPDAEALRRENVFLKAKVDLDTPAGKLLLKAYDGPLETEKVRAAAEELGALTDAAPSSPGTNEPTQRDERNALANGASFVPDQAKDPYVDARERAEALRTQGAPEENVLGEGFHHIAAAAIGGDERVLAKAYNPAD